MRKIFTRYGLVLNPKMCRLPGQGAFRVLRVRFYLPCLPKLGAGFLSRCIEVNDCLYNPAALLRFVG
jgi:hypothetical protein